VIYFIKEISLSIDVDCGCDWERTLCLANWLDYNNRKREVALSSFHCLETLEKLVGTNYFLINKLIVSLNDLIYYYYY